MKSEPDEEKTIKTKHCDNIDVASQAHVVKHLQPISNSCPPAKGSRVYLFIYLLRRRAQNADKTWTENKSCVDKEQKEREKELCHTNV